MEINKGEEKMPRLCGTITNEVTKKMWK